MQRTIRLEEERSRKGFNRTSQDLANLPSIDSKLATISQRPINMQSRLRDTILLSPNATARQTFMPKSSKFGKFVSIAGTTANNDATRTFFAGSPSHSKMDRSDQGMKPAMKKAPGYLPPPHSGLQQAQ